MAVIAQPMATDLGNRIIKVDHAGEHGAVNIYTGQIFFARFTAPHLVSELSEFRAHELRHRAVFAEELRRRAHPRCRSYWLCGIGGLVLGLVTGLLGSSAIAATTVAVESVVLGHLEHQIATLSASDPAATSAISSIVAEEQQHHDRSLGPAQAGRFWPRVLTPIVSASTQAVIWLGMRL
jgi:ubiquinone biosynthesis monooxygenase Coq7